jgi:hypothetical protein
VKELVPHPSALIESMRNMGYRPSTALADLVDNSITAGANKVSIELEPAVGQQSGWARIEDNGRGMTRDELFSALRWGGDGPSTKRHPRDLGRFGLGLKTASFSMGKRLTVVSTRDGKTHALRWDLAEIIRTGKWLPIEGVHRADAPKLKSDAQDSAKKTQDGTVVLITEIDKLRVDARTAAMESSNRSTLIKSITGHLRLVFHRFLERRSLKLQFGAAQLRPWNLLGPSGDSEELSWLKHEESLGGNKVPIRTFVIPHHKELTPAQHEMLAGPYGWNAHQGFFVYRADRLIVHGGWLGFSKPEEHCKLARITIDLPNDVDESWGLDVIKSKITPPTILLGDVERIAAAARSEAKKRYRFHGEQEAPQAARAADDVGPTAFWKQVHGKRDVCFRINRAHPLVEALIQSVADVRVADAFMHAFERLLPVSAILQQPAKSTHGVAAEPTEDELAQLVAAMRIVVDVIKSTGQPQHEAFRIALSTQPFCRFADTLQRIYDLDPASLA